MCPWEFSFNWRKCSRHSGSYVCILNLRKQMILFCPFSAGYIFTQFPIQFCSLIFITSSQKLLSATMRRLQLLQSGFPSPSLLFLLLSPPSLLFLLLLIPSRLLLFTCQAFIFRERSLNLSQKFLQVWITMSGDEWCSKSLFTQERSVDSFIFTFAGVTFQVRLMSLIFLRHWQICATKCQLLTFKI